MKVKARYSIHCDKGLFEKGDVFEINEADLWMYGDAVEAVAGLPAAPAEPEKKTAEEIKKAELEKKPANENPAKDEPKTEKPKAASRRKKISE